MSAHDAPPPESAGTGATRESVEQRLTRLEIHRDETHPGEHKGLATTEWVKDTLVKVAAGVLIVAAAVAAAIARFVE